MFDKKAFIGIVAVTLCAQSALGAASVRTGGTQKTDATVARAGSLRVNPGKTVSSTQQKTSVSQSSNSTGDSLSRVSSAYGNPGVVKTNKLTQGTAAAQNALAELEGRVEELSRSYNTLDNSYSQLTTDLGYAATTATSAKTMAESNRNQLALKMNTGDFNSAFDTRVATKRLADQPFVAEYVSTNVQAPDLSVFYSKDVMDLKLDQKVSKGNEFEQSFDSRLATKNLATSDTVNSLNSRMGVTETSVDALRTRVGAAETKISNIEENPGVNTAAVNSMIDTKITNLASKTELANALADAKQYANTKAEAAAASANSTASATFATKDSVYDRPTIDNKLIAAQQFAANQADAAFSAAKQYADALTFPETDLSAYDTSPQVDLKITTALSSATAGLEQFATAKATAAKTDANTYTDSKVSGLATQDFATTKANDALIAAKEYANGLTISGSTDLSNYDTKEEVNDKLTITTTNILSTVADTYATKTENAAKATNTYVDNTFVTKTAYNSDKQTFATKTELNAKPSTSDLATAKQQAIAEAKAYTDTAVISAG
ncbi:MAG: hypothetical protein J5742_02050, partial [Alphaproteobacteria bacterium]|nr:hypothetical protein [Alphaproteobacteria bacterium]